MRVACCVCRSAVEFEALPQPDIRNYPGCSVIVVQHPEQVTCSCGAVLALLVAGLNLGFATATVPRKQRTSGIVIPGRVS